MVRKNSHPEFSEILRDKLLRMNDFKFFACQTFAKKLKFAKISLAKVSLIKVIKSPTWNFLWYDVISSIVESIK